MRSSQRQAAAAAAAASAAASTPTSEPDTPEAPTSTLSPPMSALTHEDEKKDIKAIAEAVESTLQDQEMQQAGALDVPASLKRKVRKANSNGFVKRLKFRKIATNSIFVFHCGFFSFFFLRWSKSWMNRTNWRPRRRSWQKNHERKPKNMYQQSQIKKLTHLVVTQEQK